MPVQAVPAAIYGVCLLLKRKQHLAARRMPHLTEGSKKSTVGAASTRGVH